MNQLDPGKALGNQTVMTLFDNQAMALDNYAFGSASTLPIGLAQGATANTSIKTTSTFAYTSTGVLKSKATAEVPFTTTTHDIPANASAVQERVYMVTVNAAGTLAITAGTIASGAGNAALPERPSTDGTTPIGYVRITVAAGATPFTAGTTQPIAGTTGAITVAYTDGYPLPRFGRSF